MTAPTQDQTLVNEANWGKEDQIDKKTLEISQADDEVYTKMTDLSDELPDNSPRFVLLSYPLTLVRLYCYLDERKSLIVAYLGVWSIIRPLCYDQLPPANLR